MADYKYTANYGKLESLLEKIRTTGVPAKANEDWLRSLNFTSSNDRSFIAVLKAIGFLDTSNVPNSRWRNYRGSGHRQVLGEGLREAYTGLFDLYPDACSRSDSELEGFFRTKTDGGDQVIKRLVGTFKALCANADLGGEVTIGATAPTPSRRAVEQSTEGRSSMGPSLHIDIQVHISPESTAEQIDQIFKSMADHLYTPRE